MAIAIESYSPQHASQVQALLENYKATSMFLLSNLQTHGPRLTEHKDSGNFKCVVSEGRVVGIFVVSSGGTLLVQTDRKQEYSRHIVQDVLKERIPLCAALGDLELLNPILQQYSNNVPNFIESLRSEEILYDMTIDIGVSPPRLAEEVTIRFLTAADFEEWLPLREKYELELTPRLENAEQRTQRYLVTVNCNHWWGMFYRNELVSMACLNAQALDMGQVGGVYTKPEFRGKGLSTKVMQQLIFESRTIHKLATLILFTGETNTPAQRVYEKLGFRRIGRYGIIFGKTV